jgi:hypothetical protein
MFRRTLAPRGYVQCVKIGWLVLTEAEHAQTVAVKESK